MYKPAEQGVAISGTGDGDYFVRYAAAHDVVARMKYGNKSVKEASGGVIDELKTHGGEGGMICIDRQGEVAMPVNCSGMFRGTINVDEGVARVACWKEEKLEVIR